MFKTLLKSRLLAFFSSFVNSDRTKQKLRSKSSRIAIYILVAVLVLIVAGSIGLMIYGVESTSIQMGIKSVTGMIAVMISTIVCFIGSIFTIKSQVFEAKDNELLLSMPIAPRDIFLSRAVAVLISNFLYTSIVMLPYIVVHAIFTGFTFLEVVFTLVVYITVPCFVLTISTLFAWLLSVITMRLKNKNLVTSILGIIFFAGYLFFVMKVNMYRLITPESDIDGFKKVFIFYWPASAMEEGNALNLLFFVLIALIPAAITFLILNFTFYRIITTKAKSATYKYKEKEQKTKRVFQTLLIKDFKRFFTSPTYFLNAGVGSLMGIVFSIYICIQFSGESNKLIGTSYMPIICCSMISFASSMSLITPSSISIEDKTLWILASSPIKPKTVIWSKIMCQIIYTVPISIVSMLIPSIYFKFKPAEIVLCLLIVILIDVFCAYLGMLFGIKYPKFGWPSEAYAIKRGVSVTVTMLIMMSIGVIIAFAQFIFYYLFGVYYLTAILISAALAISIIVLHIYFEKMGETCFAKLKS